MTALFQHIVVLAARVLLSQVFIISGVGHLLNWGGLNWGGTVQLAFGFVSGAFSLEHILPKRPEHP
jgi:uncharacterized membrane protein YphA (DoxX/SURF4 family)